MPKPVRRAIVLAICLCTGGLGWAADDVPSREAIVKSAKAATAYVEVKQTQTSGSAFCVHSSGLFVTNAHLILQGTEDVTLVLDPALTTQKVFDKGKVKVLRRDRDLDLALLQVVGDQKFDALELGSDKDLVELSDVIAPGFPLGTARARKGEYPEITVTPGSITSLLRDKNRDLDRIQLNNALTLGNSGGPVLDRTGKVVGVVVSGFRGVAINNAIPVSHVQRFLAKPELVLTLPAVKAANRYAEFEFTAKAISVVPGKQPPDLELVLSTGPGMEQRFPMKLADGTYRAKTIPFPARVGPQICRVEVKYEDGSSIGGTTEDRTIRVGEKDFKLSQLRSMRPGQKPEVLFADGQRQDKIPNGLKDSSLKIGIQTLPMDLTGAAEVKVAVPEETTVLLCSVVARQGGKDVGRSSSSPLYIEGVSQPNSPSDWTKDWSKLASPDGKFTIPDGPLAGTIMGEDFKVDKVTFSPMSMAFHSGNDSIQLMPFHVVPGKDVYEFKAREQGRGRPSVITQLSSNRGQRGLRPGGMQGPGGMQADYEMRLEFGKEIGGKVPGKLYLLLPDGNGSIAGNFTLNVER